MTEFGDSFAAASRMLVRMERRFSRDVNFGKAYSDFLTDYEELNHMELVPPSTEDPSLVYYLPHHVVIRQSSLTTKLRVVFNRSQKTTFGISLNENLHTGPTLLPELFDVILRWRRYKVVFWCFSILMIATCSEFFGARPRILSQPSINLKL